MLAVAAIGCTVAIPFRERPAAGYTYASGEPLRVAVIDETLGDDWSPSIKIALEQYGTASPQLRFQPAPDGANIIIHVRHYRDDAPPVLRGYLFQPGVGGFAAVYDDVGVACNFPPSTAPVGCNGAIARAEIYLNDAIPPGSDIDARRLRLVLHEMGHALGLTRHSPDLGIAELAHRYGWPE